MGRHLEQAGLDSRKGGRRSPTSTQHCQELYIRTRCKSQGLRKSKRTACSGNCKQGIIISGWVLPPVGGQLNPDSAHAGPIYLLRYESRKLIRVISFLSLKRQSPLRHRPVNTDFMSTTAGFLLALEGEAGNNEPLQQGRYPRQAIPSARIIPGPVFPGTGGDRR